MIPPLIFSPSDCSLCSGLIAEDGGDDATRAAVVAELAKVYALPNAQVE